jgi:hypothetical protein
MKVLGYIIVARTPMKMFKSAPTHFEYDMPT